MIPDFRVYKKKDLQCSDKGSSVKDNGHALHILTNFSMKCAVELAIIKYMQISQ